MIRGLGDALSGKVVVDATNEVGGSGKLHALAELAAGAHPVRAFNTLGWESFADPVVAGQQADLLFCVKRDHIWPRFYVSCASCAALKASIRPSGDQARLCASPPGRWTSVSRCRPSAPIASMPP